MPGVDFSSNAVAGVVAHGRHLLPITSAGRAAVHPGGRQGQEGPDHLHHRGHEAHERDRGARGRVVSFPQTGTC